MNESRAVLSQGKQALMLAAAIVVPSLGVGVARFGVPIPGPASAAAVQESGAALPGVVSVGVGGTERQAITAAFRDEALKPFGPTPILNRLAELPSAPEAEPFHDQGNVDPSPHQAENTVVFVLSSVMGSSERSMAVINGKLRRIGDRLNDGWTVSAIDRDAGRVTVKSERGVSRVLSLPPQGLEPR